MTSERASGYDHIESLVTADMLKWQYRLGLDNWILTTTFVATERFSDDDELTPAECKPAWQYLRAELLFFLPILVTYGDTAIDRLVLHEQCHVLLAAEQANLKPSESDRMELSTEMTARALWVAWGESWGETR